MTFLSILATTLGSIMGIANFPQAIRIFRRKSAKDISIIAYIILIVGSIVWVFYGFEIANWPIIISNIVGTLSLASVIFGWILYGR